MLPSCANGTSNIERNQQHSMATPRHEIALIVGAGPGLSAFLARLFAREGMRVTLVRGLFIRLVVPLLACCGRSPSGPTVPAGNARFEYLTASIVRTVYSPAGMF